jgi:hypothetical protein
MSTVVVSSNREFVIGPISTGGLTLRADNLPSWLSTAPDQILSTAVLTIRSIVGRQVFRSTQPIYTGPQQQPTGVFAKTYEFRVTLTRLQMKQFANCFECTWVPGSYDVELFLTDRDGVVLSGLIIPFGSLPCAGCSDWDGEPDPVVPLPPSQPGVGQPAPGDRLPPFPADPPAVCLPPPLVFPANPGIPTPCS